MAQQTCNQFEPNSNTSSATICKWCGQEKFLHTNYILNTNKTVTAVEWLVQELQLEGYPYIIKQAKQMEKEQIIDAWNNCKHNKWGNENTIVDGEEYYNETYNK